MSDNNKPLNNEKSHNGKADNELEQLLLQVFGSKENLEKERQKQAERKAEGSKQNTSEENVSKQDNKGNLSGKAVNHQGGNRPHQGPPQNRKRPPDGRNNGGVKKRPPNASQGRPMQNGERPKKSNANGGTPQRPKNNGNVQQRNKRPLPNGQKAVNTGTKPNPKGSAPQKNIKGSENNKNSLSNKQAQFKEKLSKMSGKKRVAVIAGIFLGILLILALLIYGLYSFYYSLFGRYSGKLNDGEYIYNSSDYVDDSDTMTPEEAEAALKKQLEGKASDPMKDKDVMNILLIGEDLRDTDSEQRGNTDVMLMISLNKKQKTITMTSFMRDAWVNIEGYGMAKLNAAYWRDGPELLKSTIENYYGVAIDRYVIVNFKSFIKIVDTLGGITMDVRDDEAEGMKAPMAEQNNILGNKKGTDYLQKGGTGLRLNGNQALAFARLRYVGNADYERTERQRRVIAEIINESKNLSLLEINDLVQEIFPQVKLDITKGEMASLLLNCLDYMNYDIQQLRMPADGLFSEDIINGLSVLSPDYKANSELLIDTIYGSGDSSVTDDSQAAEQADADITDYNDYNN